MWGCSKQEPSQRSPTTIEPLPVLPDWPNAESMKDTVDIARMLDIIYQLESSSGANCEARFEPGFLARYGNNPPMPKLRRLFGDKAAASSYSCYQIMICTAWTHDFRYSPEQLSNESNAKIVAEYLIQLYATKYSDLLIRDRIHKIFKRYNGSDEYAIKASKLYFDE